MTTLDTLQRVFQDYLIHQENHHIETLTAEGKLLPKAEQLEIYFNAYRLRLLEILASDFPNMQTLLGIDAFDECALHYLAAYPSHFFSVRYFGQHFAQFLQESSPYKDSPYLAELATFEWALNDTLDAEDSDTVTLESLTTIPAEKWGDLQFCFHPSLQIMNFVWETPHLWKELQAITLKTKEGQGQIPQYPFFEPKPTEPTTWIAWRKTLSSQFRSLSPIQAFILHTLQKGATFAELCEALCEKLEEEMIPKTALGFIQQCINDKLVSKISY